MSDRLPNYLVREGTHAFWSVECRYKPPRPRYYEEWQTIGGNQIAKVPTSLRYKNVDTGAEHFPFQEWSASGTVWQRTHNHGLEKRSQAIALAAILADYNPDMDFRVVKVRTTLVYEEVITFEMKKEKEDAR